MSFDEISQSVWPHTSGVVTLGFLIGSKRNEIRAVLQPTLRIKPRKVCEGDGRGACTKSSPCLLSSLLDDLMPFDVDIRDVCARVVLGIKLRISHVLDDTFPSTWRAVSVVRTHFPSRGPMFSSQPPCDGTQPSITRVPEYPVPSSDLQGHQAHMQYTYVRAKYSYTYR